MDLSPSERAILVDLLLHGDDMPSNIAERTDFARETISRNCSRLVERDFARDKGGGVYKLTNAGVLIAQNIQSE
ncbi:MarR family transcriptional regulator [Natronolimnohabitans innermongolicus]